MSLEYKVRPKISKRDKEMDTLLANFRVSSSFKKMKIHNIDNHLSILKLDLKSLSNIVMLDQGPEKQ